MSEQATAYLHPTYAASFAEFGSPRKLPRSGAWILTRAVPGHHDLMDAMAIYPFLCCEAWPELKADLDDLDDIVSLTVIPDPFGDYDVDLLKSVFPDCLNTQYKFAEVADLSRSYEEFCSASRRKAAQKALANLTIEVAGNPADHLDEWCELYGDLIAKHKIEGLRAFSRNAFEGLLNTPGLVYIRAIHQGQTVGVHTWMVQGNVAYAHLAAYDKSLGYKLYAPSALYWFAYDHFVDKVKWLFYGGSAAGADSEKQDNLINFKKSWGSEVRPVYLCGQILLPDVYQELSKEKSESGYFPIYRQGEF